MEDLGFIILRHVNSERTNLYWMHCYDCIRNHYPENTIVIIDDNSNYDLITEKSLYKTTIINSEYHQRGELLPYLYYSQFNWFKCAVILHDSVFINRPMDFMTNTYKFLWNFNCSRHFPEKERELILNLKNNEKILSLYDKNTWSGCFGCMSSISHIFLRFVNHRHNLFNLIPVVTCRNDRQALERVIACILQVNYQEQNILGNIAVYCEWNIGYDNKEQYRHLPLTKIWTGR